MDSPRDYILRELVNTLSGIGFVSEEAEDKLREAVEIVMDDPRNQEDCA
jgi:hypothetical protein